MRSMRCLRAWRRVTRPEEPIGAEAHFRALESLYAAAPINRLFESELEIPEGGVARIRITIDERYWNAPGAEHCKS